ncbi:hypothetical protein V7O66_13950 [Methanolobus sp. ZRKC3]|uniref:hypothetical protein n=1 Tax=Methanolobus sp. ZRKC3 TaxID=3125786 RepID=UPI00324DFFF9
MIKKHPTSFHLAPADIADLDYLVAAGVFTNRSDAGRGVMRKGIEATKKERGI